MTIYKAIIIDHPSELVIDLDMVTTLSVLTVHALLAGYVTAIDHGVCYHVINARDRANTCWRPPAPPRS